MGGTSTRGRFYYINLFFLYCFWWTRVPFFVFILLCHPSEDSLQWSTIPDGSPSKDRQSALAGEIAGFEPGTVGSSLVSLPMSHHCSLFYINGEGGAAWEWQKNVFFFKSPIFASRSYPHPPKSLYNPPPPFIKNIGYPKRFMLYYWPTWNHLKQRPAPFHQGLLSPSSQATTDSVYLQPSRGMDLNSAHPGDSQQPNLGSAASG